MFTTIQNVMMENTVYKMNKVEGPLIWTSLIE